MTIRNSELYFGYVKELSFAYSTSAAKYEAAGQPPSKALRPPTASL